MSIAKALDNGEHAYLAQWASDGCPADSVWQAPTEAILDAACVFMQLRVESRQALGALKARVTNLNNSLRNDGNGPLSHLARLKLAVMSMLFAKFTTDMNGQEIQAYYLLEILWRSPDFWGKQSVVIGGYRIVDVIEFFFRLRHPEKFISLQATLRLNGETYSLRGLPKRERQIHLDYECIRDSLQQAWIQSVLPALPSTPINLRRSAFENMKEDLPKPLRRVSWQDNTQVHL